MSVNRTELVAQIAERADLTKAKADEALACLLYTSDAANEL